MAKFFKGLYTALITPFNNGVIDKNSFEKLLHLQIDANVDGVVVAGSTGEVSTLSKDEYIILLKLMQKILKNKTKFIAGISANIQENAIDKAKIAQDNGANAIMCVMPYYNKPPQRGLIKYFEAIHEATSVPIMLYSVPSRTGVDFTDETIIELAKFDRIIGLKDAGTDLERPLRLYDRLPSRFSLLSGDDANCVAYSSHGGVGCVSVISNIFPKICKKLQDLLSEGNFSASIELQAKLINLCKAIFVETNPIPIKFAAAHLKLCSSEVRLPLIEMVDSNLKENIVKTIDELSSLRPRIMD